MLTNTTWCRVWRRYLGSFHSPRCLWGWGRSECCGSPGPPSGEGEAFGSRSTLLLVPRRWSAARGFHGTPGPTAERQKIPLLVIQLFLLQSVSYDTAFWTFVHNTVHPPLAGLYVHTNQIKLTKQLNEMFTDCFIILPCVSDIIYPLLYQCESCSLGWN